MDHDWSFDMAELDDQDGKPIREYSSKWSCHYCIPEMVYMGYGNCDEILTCYFENAYQSPLPGFPEIRG